jgi:uncharacterized delta-60 repeat protein
MRRSNIGRGGRILSLAVVCGSITPACGGGGDDGSNTTTTPPPPKTYSVGGSVTGLVGTLALQNNGSDTAQLTSDGGFTFATRLKDGDAYDVTIATPPASQTCQVEFGSGTIDKGDVSDVIVTCVLKPGVIDASFGTQGVALAPPPAGSTVTINAMTLQANGAVVAVGKEKSGSETSFVAVRFTATGALDTAFGAGGFVIVNFPDQGYNYAGYDDEALDVVVQSDGKIFMVGRTTDNYQSSYLGIVRLNTDGSFDSTFQTTGVWMLAELTEAGGAAVGIATGGALVIGGYAGDATTRLFWVLRLKNGNPDPTFAAVGSMTFGWTNEFDEARSLAVQSDGRIILAGAGWPNRTTPQGGRLARVLVDGTGSDPTFDNPRTIGVNAWRAVALDASNRIIAVGQSVDARRIVVNRFTTAGKADTSFGSSGSVSSTPGSSQIDSPADVAVQTDGSVVVAGTRSGAMLLLRFTAAGLADTTFGDGSGAATYPLSGSAQGRALVVQSDGNYLVGGTDGSSGASPKTALVRVLR